MKRAFSIAWVVFFIVSITAKDVTCIGWEIWYISNKSYVAKELCENTARPAMKCNGKCYLAKQLKKAEQEQQDAKKNAPSQQLKLKSVDWISVGSDFGTQKETALPCLKKLYQTAITKPTLSFVEAVFHPPTV